MRICNEVHKTKKKQDNYIYLVMKLSIAHLVGHIYWTVGITAVNH